VFCSFWTGCLPSGCCNCLRAWFYILMKIPVLFKKKYKIARQRKFLIFCLNSVRRACCVERRKTVGGNGVKQLPFFPFSCSLLPFIFFYEKKKNPKNLFSLLKVFFFILFNPWKKGARCQTVSQMKLLQKSSHDCP
jgi:hypothetical protein